MFFDFTYNINFSVVENYICSHSLGHFYPFRNTLDGDNLVRPAQPGTNCGTQANRSLSEDGYSIAYFHLRTVRSRKTGSHNIAYKQDLFVCQFIRNYSHIILSIRYFNIFCLGTVNGIAEFPRLLNRRIESKPLWQ